MIMFYIYSYHFGIYICILTRSSRTEMFFKKVLLKILQNSQETTCCIFLSAKSNFIKIDTPALVFSCECLQSFQENSF